MNFDEERKEVIRSVRQNGNALSLINEEYQDDEEVVANAILGCDFGGVGVLQYASKRLQSNSKLLKLAEFSKEFQAYRIKVLSSSKSKEEISRDLEIIEEAKDQLLEKYFSSKKKKENDSGQSSTNDPFLEKIVISDELRDYIDKGISSIVIKDSSNYSQSMPSIIDELGDYTKNCFDYYYGLQTNAEFETNLYGIELSEQLHEYYENNPYYQVLSEYGQDRGITQVKLEPAMLLSIDLIKLSLKNMPEEKAKESKFLTLLKLVDEYVAAHSFAINNVEDVTPSMMLRRRVKEQLQSISPEEYSNLMHNYFDFIKQKEDLDSFIKK